MLSGELPNIDSNFSADGKTNFTADSTALVTAHWAAHGTTDVSNGAAIELSFHCPHRCTDNSAYRSAICGPFDRTDGYSNTAAVRSAYRTADDTAKCAAKCAANIAANNTAIIAANDTAKCAANIAANDAADCTAFVTADRATYCSADQPNGTADGESNITDWRTYRGANYSAIRTANRSTYNSALESTYGTTLEPADSTADSRTVRSTHKSANGRAVVCA
jgi:hypothetical protein